MFIWDGRYVWRIARLVDGKEVKRPPGSLTDMNPTDRDVQGQPVDRVLQSDIDFDDISGLARMRAVFTKIEHDEKTHYVRTQTKVVQGVKLPVWTRIDMSKGEVRVTGRVGGAAVMLDQYDDMASMKLDDLIANRRTSEAVKKALRIKDCESAAVNATISGQREFHFKQAQADDARRAKRKKAADAKKLANEGKLPLPFTKVETRAPPPETAETKAVREELERKFQARVKELEEKAKLDRETLYASTYRSKQPASASHGRRFPLHTQPRPVNVFQSTASPRTVSEKATRPPQRPRPNAPEDTSTSSSSTKSKKQQKRVYTGDQPPPPAQKQQQPPTDQTQHQQKPVGYLPVTGPFDTDESIQAHRRELINSHNKAALEKWLGVDNEEYSLHSNLTLRVFAERLTNKSPQDSMLAAKRGPVKLLQRLNGVYVDFQIRHHGVTDLTAAELKDRYEYVTRIINAYTANVEPRITSDFEPPPVEGLRLSRDRGRRSVWLQGFGKTTAAACRARQQRRFSNRLR